MFLRLFAGVWSTQKWSAKSAPVFAELAAKGAATSMGSASLLHRMTCSSRYPLPSRNATSALSRGTDPNPVGGCSRSPGA